jgi:WD40 repeat protein
MKPACLLVSAALFFGLSTFTCQPPAGKAPRTTGTRRENRRPPLVVAVSAAAFSPDNKYVVVGYSDGGKLLTLWEVATGKEVRSLPGHTQQVDGVAFVEGGKRVLSGGHDGRLLLHDVASGKLLQSRRAYEHMLLKFATSADGRRALTAGLDKIAGNEVGKLWDVDRLELQRTFGQGQFDSWGMALSPDSRWALSSCQWNTLPPGRVCLWDLRTGDVAQTLPGSQGWWVGVAASFSPNSRLALVNKSKYVGKAGIRTQLALWDVASGKVLRLLQGEGVAPAQFTPDGKQVVGAARSAKGKLWFNFWDVATGKVGRSVGFAPPGELMGSFLSPDGRLALAVSGFLEEGSPPRSPLGFAVWNLETGRVIQQWTRRHIDP